MYAATGWAYRIGSHVRTKFARLQRQVLLAVTKANHTVFTAALPMLTGVLPVNLTIAERACIYSVLKLRNITMDECCIYHTDLEAGKISVSETVAEITREVLCIWQTRCSASTIGRTMFRFFRNVSDHLSPQLTLDHNVFQFLSGHGDFRSMLFGFSLAPDERWRCSEVG